MVSDLDSLTDGELLALAAGGPDAFALFYRRHVEGVLTYFRRRTGGAEIALDLTAETFARALEAAPRFQLGDEPAAAWLYSIARNLLTDSYRHGRVEDDVTPIRNPAPPEGQAGQAGADRAGHAR